MGYVISFVVGLLLGGAATYIWHTKIMAKVGAVTVAADKVKAAL